LAEELIEFNKNSAVFQEKIISQYIKDHGLKMTKTGTGLWYSVQKEGTGKNPEEGETLTVEYDVFMLNDSLCYSSKDKGPYQFRLGMADVESGVHEGIQYLKEGGEGKFIVPSYLAHGLIGDFNKIPPKTPVIYDMRLVKVQ